MEHKGSYTRVSELLASRRAQKVAAADCRSATDLIEQIFQCVDVMDINEREALMRRITGWVIGKEFGSRKVPVLVELHRYCVAASLMQDPSWDPPKLRL